MNLAEIQEELLDIKRELDQRKLRGDPTKQLAPLRERLAAIEKHLGISKIIAA